MPRGIAGRIVASHDPSLCAAMVFVCGMHLLAGRGHVHRNLFGRIFHGTGMHRRNCVFVAERHPIWDRAISL